MVGRNPGYDEDRSGQPFTGQPGTVLRGSATSPGIYLDAYDLRKRASIFLTHAVKCYTLDNDKPSLARHARPCSSHLHNDFSHILSVSGPRVAILTLGAEATDYVCRLLLNIGKHSLNDVMNAPAQAHPLYSHTIHLFATYHPAFYLRNPNIIASIDSHLALLSDWIDDLIVTPTRPTLILPRSPQ